MRILIVEDDESLAGLIASYLAPFASVPPIIATNMKDAMKVIDDAAPINLVTLDLALPDSATAETLARVKEIKAKKPDALVVVVTGVLRPEIEEEALLSGADGFMSKTASCRNSTTFLDTLRDIGRSILRQPVRYQKNIELMEKLTEKICQHVASTVTKIATPQPNA